MRATINHYEIPAHDPERATRFYQEVFGWSIEPRPWVGGAYFAIRGSEGPPGSGENAGIRGGLLGWGDGSIPHPLLVIHVEGVELADFLHRIELAGGAIDQPATPISSMGSFARFRDTEGNLLGIWQELQPS
jgi:predicted enzyme related to lactoylglutathione lyase